MVHCSDLHYFPTRRSSDLVPVGEAELYRQASAREWNGITISPELISAGVSKLVEFRRAAVDRVYAVIEVFWAMRELETAACKTRSNRSAPGDDKYIDRARS